MVERAGYTLVVYAIDVSSSMAKEQLDPETGKTKSKLDLVKEYVARECEPKISSGRKTECVGILSFGGRTAEPKDLLDEALKSTTGSNNQANRKFVEQNPHDDDPPYAFVACDVAIQTARPKTVEEVMNLEVGEHEGNPISAVMVALDMIQTHKHTKSWSLEIVLITDGESAFEQDEYEDAMDRLDDMSVKLSVIGLGFQPLEEAVDKSKTRNKRLSEKFWRTFYELLQTRLEVSTASQEILPIFKVFEDALVDSRYPRPSIVNGTVSGIDLRIGSTDIDMSQAIVIPIKYSKATMKASPPSLSKAWKGALDLQGPPRNGSSSATHNLASSLAQRTSTLQSEPSNSDMAALMSAEVKHYSSYAVRKQRPEPDQSQAQATQATQKGAEPESTQPEHDEEEEEEEPVAKEDIVKAWRFGSTWVPVEKDVFEPLETTKGVEILGFFPRANIKRHLFMGEVRFIWPDTTTAKGQIQFSSLVEAMALRDMVAIVRWVLKDQADPVIGLCAAEMDYPGVDKRLDYMYWVKLPFAEDEHNFWFPSLTTYKTSTGKIIEEHPLLPTQEQCDLMDEFVQSMDLDAHALKLAEASYQEGQRTVEERLADGDIIKWFSVNHSFNPVIHRIKEAIFHASLTANLDKDPLGPPRPELTRYFYTPDEVIDAAADVTNRLKESLAIKKVPAAVRRLKMEREELRPDEGYIDVDELFGDAKGEASTSAEGKGGSSTQNGAGGPSSKGKEKARGSSAESDVLPPPTASKSKPKKGRLVSNERPLEDFKRLIEGEGDLFKKAIQDLGAVVKENVEASFSRQAFPLAIECLEAMRSTALTYEEVETYNDYIDDLQAFINEPNFKHKDFWNAFENAEESVAKISPEEAKKALMDYD